MQAVEAVVVHTLLEDNLDIVHMDMDIVQEFAQDIAQSAQDRRKDMLEDMHIAQDMDIVQDIDQSAQDKHKSVVVDIVELKSASAVDLQSSAVVAVVQHVQAQSLAAVLHVW